MASRLPTPRTTAPDRQYSITLGGVVVSYRLQWRPRAEGWYFRLYAADGVTLVSDWMRLRPGGLCTQDPTADGHPDGWFVVDGASDGGQRDDLFTDMRVWFVPSSEVA